MTSMKGQRAAIYCRISDDRIGQEAGVKRQEADCRRLIAERGWTVAEVYVDNDLSAYRGDPRPSYRRLLQDVEATAVTAIVAWHSDRLYRHMKDLEEFIAIVEQAGAKVATVKAGDVDLGNASGRMVARHIGTAARYESEQKAERIQRKHEEIAVEGRWKGGPRPYGYDLARELDGRPKKDGRLVVIGEEAEVVQEAARRVLAGESIYAVCQDLNRRGVPTAQSNGHAMPWRTPTLRRILTNPTISGKREYRGEIIGLARWEPIITDTDWMRLRRLLLDEGRAVGRRPRSYLLTGGIARCGQCGGEKFLHAQRRGTGARVYVCIKSVDKDGCGKLTCAANPLDALLVEAVLQRLDGPGLAAVLSASENADQHNDDDEASAELEGRLEELAKMFGAGEIARKEWLAARSTIDGQLQQIRHRQSRTDRGRALTPFTKAGSLRKAWPDLSLDQRRAVIKAVVDRVVIKSSTRKGPIFDDERVNVIWRA